MWANKGADKEQKLIKNEDNSMIRREEEVAEAIETNWEVYQMTEEDQNYSQGQDAAVYEDLSSFSRYRIDEDGTDNEIQAYEGYAKALQHRVRAKLELKAIFANFKAELAEKSALQTILKHLRKAKEEKRVLSEQALKKQISYLKEQLILQQQLKASLKFQLKSIEQLIVLAEDDVYKFPREKLSSYNTAIQGEFSSFKLNGEKIVNQLCLQQILLSNVQQIMRQFPSKDGLI